MKQVRVSFWVIVALHAGLLCLDTRTKGRYSAYTTMSGPEISEATLDEDVEEL